MSANRLSYTVVTPWNEAANLPRLAHALATQTRRPKAWIIVDSGSTDGTRMVAETLAQEHDWVRVRMLAAPDRAGRGAPIVRALTVGIESLEATPDILVNVDADVSMSRDYFSCLLAAFEGDEALGIASGSAHESRRGVWKQQHCTRGERVGRVASLQMGMSPGRSSFRGTDRVGRHRRAQGECARMDDENAC